MYAIYCLLYENLASLAVVPFHLSCYLKCIIMRTSSQSISAIRQRDSVANSGKIVSQMGAADLITDNGMGMECFCTHSSGQCAASNPGNLSFATLGWEESEDGNPLNRECV